MFPKRRDVIATFPTEAEARAVAAALQAEGIAAVVVADDAGGAYPFLHSTLGVRVLAPPEDVERARELLDRFEDADPAS